MILIVEPIYFTLFVSIALPFIWSCRISSNNSLKYFPQSYGFIVASNDLYLLHLKLFKNFQLSAILLSVA